MPLVHNGLNSVVGGCVGKHEQPFLFGMVITLHENIIFPSLPRRSFDVVKLDQALGEVHWTKGLHGRGTLFSPVVDR